MPPNVAPAANTWPIPAPGWWMPNWSFRKSCRSASLPHLSPIANAGRYAAAATPLPEITGGGLLDQLRRQAEARQREMHSDMAERTATNEAIDQALKHVFFFLHELVQQLNIVKPGIPRNYP
jgi:hypothetical protein